MRRALALIALTVLAGCSGPAEPTNDGPGLDVTSTTGGIRGVVVDETITPVEGVQVSVESTQLATTSDERGEFVFSGLDPGTYFLRFSKIGHEVVQTSAIVEAGVEHPPVVTVQVPRIPGLNPSFNTAVFDGYYECAFALTFITDSCDFVVRTIHDETGVGPRNVQNNVNTAYYPLEPDVETVVLEGFFDNSEVSTMWFQIADTPIDNACDCSHDFADVTTDTGYGMARTDKGGDFPSYERDFAVRGFLPFTDTMEASYAANFGFQIFTTKFHSYTAPEGWNMLEADTFPQP